MTTPKARQKMSERQNQKTIGEMRPGDEGWTLPWAVHAPRGLRWLIAPYYLNAAYPIEPEPDGAARLKVRRDGAGWHIDDSRFRAGFRAGDADRYHGYWRDGWSVPVRSVIQ